MSRDFRRVLGAVPTAVTLIAALTGEGEPLGLVVGTFTSVSLDPPLVGVLVDLRSSTLPRLLEAGRFCASVLAAEQEELARRMAKPSDDRFEGVGWHASSAGLPVLDGSVAWIDTVVVQTVRLGDHELIVGRVEDLAVTSPAPSLIFQRGEFGEFTSTSAWLLDELLLR